jgi:CHAD domain-containing protein
MLNARELDGRIRKLRKSLKGFPKDPTLEQVHDLRTRARRVEAILQALGMNVHRSARRVLAELKAVRKRSGKVRDMDVFTSHIVGLGPKDDPECVVRLVHHLGVERHRHAGKLHATVQSTAPDLRQRLKRARRRMDAILARFNKAKVDLDDKGGDQAQSDDAPLHAMADAMRLYRELAAVPRLGPNNLHAFRIEVKRLRYVLEMAEAHDQEQQPFLEELKKVQDAIGEWHDWLELTGIARHILQQHRGCKLVKKIDDICRKKYGEALRVAEQLRDRYLQANSAGKSSRRKRDEPAIPGPVLVAS